MLPPEFEAPLAAVRARRPDLRLDLRWFPAVTSTMDVAGAMLAEGAAAGTVVVADAQTEGRGRRGRHWESPPRAGLYFSLMWRPGASAPASLLTLAAGVGVREGLRATTGLAPDLKWPNDLIVGARKVAGILAEGHAVGTPHAAVVIGVGINVGEASHSPEVSARATSLESELGREVDRGQVLAGVLEALADRLAQLDGDAGGILHAWRAAAPSAAGTRVEWDAADGPRHGTSAGIDDTGALLVKTATGVERIIAGEVRWHLT